MARSLEFWTVGRISAALGALVGLAVVLTLGDPGITIDEPLDVRPGRKYVATLRARGWRFFDRDVVTAVFRDNAEHPPLGRWLLGIASTLGEPFEPLLGESDPFVVHAGRLAPALAFALLVALVALAAGRHAGRAGAVAAGLGLLLMPRPFAHAHAAALDTFVALFWTAALLAAGRALASPRPIRSAVPAGAVWGLALLTKIPAWLLPPILLAWALVRHRSGRSLVALAAWAASGLAVFVAGWPWLWYDTLDRGRAYLGTAGRGRTQLLVEYLGRVYADRDVPWHYPWLYFAATVPVGLHALGLAGLVAGWRGRRADPAPLLPAGAILGLLAVFSTDVPVYDGERLFLAAFPLWAILIGRGFAAAWGRSRRARVRGGLVALLLAQGYGVVALHPFQLSYYNALVGGLPGAERLGLELTYWGDTLDARLLHELALRARPGQAVAVAPTLHHIQPTAVMTAELNRDGVMLVDDSALLGAGRAPGTPRASWLLAFRRTAYWRQEVRRVAGAAPPVAVRRRQGVWLSGLWRLPAPPTPGTRPARP